jgi:hypothetical protein
MTDTHSSTQSRRCHHFACTECEAPYTTRHAYQPTCSISCGQIRRRRLRAVFKPCQVCKTPIRVSLSTYVQTQTCSRECYWLWKTRKSATNYVVSPSGCWLWTGSLSDEGYPTSINWKGRSSLAHRTFYLRLKGPIPDGYQLDHLCRERRCVNPDHLEPVTPVENTRRSAATKLTVVQVSEIRRLLPMSRKPWSKPTPATIAPLFGVSRRTVAQIAAGETWADVV